jgi:hypothetical protein
MAGTSLVRVVAHLTITGMTNRWNLSVAAASASVSLLLAARFSVSFACRERERASAVCITLYLLYAVTKIGQVTKNHTIHNFTPFKPDIGFQDPGSALCKY